MALSGLLAAPQAPPTLLAHLQVLLVLLIPGTITPPPPPPAPNQEAHSLLLLTSHISVSKFCGFHFLKSLQILPSSDIGPGHHVLT